MKGSTKIILTNVETGEQEIHEDENLVTSAIDKIINISFAMNQAPNSYLLPIATQLLGGIMLFDGDLTESPDNVHFPVEAHLVGYADQSTNTSDTHRGSYNSVESGKTDTGFVSVWDFGTHQANGTIKSVARTSASAGASPLMNFRGPAQSTSGGWPDADETGWRPIRYDGEYLYMLKGDSSTHIMRLAKVKIPMLRMGVADYSDVARTYEAVASWNTEMFTYTAGSSSRTVYADSESMYEDGRDGYIYCVCNGLNSEYKTYYAYDLNYFTIRYDDGSYDKSNLTREITGTDDYSAENPISRYRYPDLTYGHINHGVYYKLGNNRKVVHIIPLDNPASYRTVQIIANDSPDYIKSLRSCSPVSGGVYLDVYHYLNPGSEYHNGFLYPDGAYIIPDISGVDTTETQPGLRTTDPDLTIWLRATTYGSYNPIRSWATNYLGTINNLSSAITKTAAQTMKIVYTLTDVDE